ncbi:McrC family protein [Dietzia sp.]|uniref:McrC family protein n=1 Tax=Dietzia sp. TaxID=1871616 RepID=UPI002FD943E7
MVATSTIEFDEFDRKGRIVELTGAEAVSLSGTGLLEVLPVRSGHWRLIPNGRVGAVRIGTHSISVLPHANLGLSELFFLLDYAPHGAFLSSSIGATETEDLWTSMARSFISLAEPELARGLLRGYRRVDDALSTVRGRIRISDQIRRRPGMTLPLEVSYSEFTPNIAENRILHTAMYRLQYLPGLPDAVRRQLAQLSFRLADVDILGHGQPLPEWTPSRLNARFHDALVLAERILRNVWLDVDPLSESTTVAAFVAEMPSLFESFVADVLSDEIDTHGEELLRDPVVYLEDVGDSDAPSRHSVRPDTARPGAGRVDPGRAEPGKGYGTVATRPVDREVTSGAGSALSTAGRGSGAAARPERSRHANGREADLISVPTGIVYTRGGAPVATFAPVYPTTADGELDSHYRLLAACTALGVKQAYLVYPADRRGAAPRPRRIVHTDISILEFPVDLADGPEGARSALAELAAMARNLEGGPTRPEGSVAGGAAKSVTAKAAPAKAEAASTPANAAAVKAAPEGAAAKPSAAKKAAPQAQKSAPAKKTAPQQQQQSQQKRKPSRRKHGR